MKPFQTYLIINHVGDQRNRYESTRRTCISVGKTCVAIYYRKACNLIDQCTLLHSPKFWIYRPTLLFRLECNRF